MRTIVASLLCVSLIVPSGPADAQCAGVSCGVSAGYGYGYGNFGRGPGAVYAPYSYRYPASSYAAYATPYAVRSGTSDVPVFSQYGGSGHVYTTAGDPAALTAWIRVNDPARGVQAAQPVQPNVNPSILPSPLPPTPSPSLGGQDPVGNAFVAWLNGHRAARGLGPVAWDANLVSLCAANNANQRSRGLGHWFMGCRRQNAGMGSYQQVITMWVASPPHAAALFDASITRVAVAGDGAYWTFDAN